MSIDLTEVYRNALLKKGFSPESIQPVAEDVVAAAERQYGRVFPKAYRDWLLLAGNGVRDPKVRSGSLWPWLAWRIEDFPHIYRCAEDILLDAGDELGNNEIPIVDYLGESTILIRDDQGDDPPIYRIGVDDVGRIDFGNSVSVSQFILRKIE